jgi:Lon protease-like protein
VSEYEHNEHLLDEIQRLRESNFHLREDCEKQKQRIHLLIAERDTARRQADQQYNLREEFRNLLGTDDVEQGVAVVREMKERIKRLEEWKDSAMAVEREWDANAISTMLGGQLGESQRVVIMREVPRLLERIKRLEEAGDEAICPFEYAARVRIWTEAKEAKL